MLTPFIRVHFLTALTEEIQAVLLSRENTKHLHRGRYGYYGHEIDSNAY
jgi:hypothetical protein